MSKQYPCAKSNKLDTYEVEEHPFETYIPSNATRLIIGTFPTYKDNYKVNFFYSGQDNLFWNVLENVFNTELIYNEGEIAVIERKKLLKDNNIGITDMLLKCYRKNKWSSDESLFPIVHNDIFEILKTNRAIRTLVLTSRTKIYGALGLLETLFLQRSIDFDWPVKRKDNILEGKFEFNRTTYNILVPYSPSPRLIKGGITTKADLIEMYRCCLI